MEQNLNVTRCYIENGADPNAVDVWDSTTPLGHAARCGYIEMVNLMLDYGADPNLPEERLWARPLAYAGLEGHAEVVELLSQRGART